MVRWTTGEQSLADFSSDVADRPVWEPLRDERLFAQVRVTHHGMVIQWPEPARDDGNPEIDVDADGLCHMIQKQNGAVAAQ